jgi:DNA-binding transcriptional LysR family regulator
LVIAQPTLSQQIRRLEQIVGQQTLFEIADNLTAPATPQAAELISLTTA